MKKLDAEAFLREVEGFISPETTYIDALIQYAQTKGIEVEVVAEIVKKHQVVKARLQRDAERLNLMTEKTRSLPFDESDE